MPTGDPGATTPVSGAIKSLKQVPPTGHSQANTNEIPFTPAASNLSTAPTLVSLQPKITSLRPLMPLTCAGRGAPTAKGRHPLNSTPDTAPTTATAQASTAPTQGFTDEMEIPKVAAPAANVGTLATPNFPRQDPPFRHHQDSTVSKVKQGTNTLGGNSETFTPVKPKKHRMNQSPNSEEQARFGILFSRIGPRQELERQPIDIHHLLSCIISVDPACVILPYSNDTSGAVRLKSFLQIHRTTKHSWIYPLLIGADPTK